MTAPPIQQPDPMLRLQYYHETGQDDLGKKYEQYLRETGQYKEAPAGHDWHGEYRSGALAKRMAGANEREAANLSDEKASLGETPLDPVATHLTNLAEGIPGVERAQAGVRSLVKSQPYSEALSDIRGNVNQLPATVKYGERIAGALPLTALLPGSPAIQGMTLGAADQALSANEESGSDRIKNTLIGGGLGAVTGKVLSLGRTTGAAKAPFVKAAEPTANLVTREAERTAASSPLYDSFRALGDLGETPKLKAILDFPVVAKAVETVQNESPSLAALPRTDARVLDAVYKRVGDKAFRALHGYETDEARSTLLDAIGDAANAKGGSYRAPVGVFREHSQGMEAVQRGKDALNNAVSPSGGSLKTALTKSPAALKQDFANLSPEEQQGVLEGLYGQVGRRGTVAHVGRVPLPLPSKALLKGDALANQLDPRSTAALTALLASLNSPFANR